MPPAAPLPTTITSQGPESGLMEAASWRDASVIAARSRSSVGSAATSGLGLLSAVRTVLAVHGQAADELHEVLVALVLQLLLDADLGGVVAVDGGLLGLGEELLEQRPWHAARDAHVAEQRLHLRRLGLGLLVAREVEAGIGGGGARLPHP